MITVLLWELLPCKAVYGNTIYRYKYVTDFVNVGTELLNKEGTNNCHKGYPVEQKTFFPEGFVLYV
jgi:hypothetical protein